MNSLNEKNYDKFILKGSLAIEMYTVMNNLSNESEEKINNMYTEIKKYRELNKKTLEDKAKIVSLVFDLIDTIGVDKFVIYEDGDVNAKIKMLDSIK